MSTTRLSRSAWVEGATALLAEGGLSAVAVEPLAKRLGATKGSFYWHFGTRDDLVRAVLDDWRERHTEAVIRRVESAADPRDRLRTLFTEAMGGAPANADDGRVELRLLASLDDPVVAAALHEVTSRRVDYIATCYRQLGLGGADADRYAALAYATYLGLLQAERVLDGGLLARRDRQRFLGFLEERLVIGPEHAGGVRPQ